MISFSSGDSYYKFSYPTSGYWRFGDEPTIFLFTWHVIEQSISTSTSKISWQIICNDPEIDSAGIQLEELEFWLVNGPNPIGGSFLSTFTLTSPKTLTYGTVVANGTFDLPHTQDYTWDGGFTSFIRYLKCSNGLIYNNKRADFNPISTSEDGIYFRYFTVEAIIPYGKAYQWNVSVPPAKIGDSVTIRIFPNLNGQSSQATHYNLYYSAGDYYKAIVKNLTSNSYTWTLPEELYYTFQEMIGTGRLFIEEFVNGSYLNTHYFEFCYTINPADCQATINYTITDTNPVTVALTGDSSRIVKYYSDVAWTVRAIGAYDNPIWKVAAATPNQYISGNLSIASASGTFDYLTSKEITFEAMDYRNLVTRVTADFPWVEYIALTNTTNTKNPTAEGTVEINVKGNYFNGSFGAQNNTLTVQYRYKKISEETFSNWINITPNFNGNTYTATTTLTGMDYKEAYELETQAFDKIITANSGIKTIKAKTVFDWSKEDFHFNVPVTIEGDTEITGDVTINGNISSYNLPSKLLAGTWTPICNACSTPDNAYGTYMRVGNTCVINFYFGGIFTSTQTYVTFSGLPFTPSDDIRWQGGGGNCSGGYLPANSPFACWNIETAADDYTKKIYGRTCNITMNTSAGTRNSGYVGSKTGESFHATGTICYKIVEGE